MESQEMHQNRVSEPAAWGGFDAVLPGARGVKQMTFKAPSKLSVSLKWSDFAFVHVLLTTLEGCTLGYVA